MLIGAGVVAGGLVWALDWPLAPALAFGALIAATDPIAVIAMLREAGVKGRLRLVIESESLFNDGAAALLFALILPALTLERRADAAGDRRAGAADRRRRHRRRRRGRRGWRSRWPGAPTTIWSRRR